MPFAIELTLDAEAGDAVRALWRALADAGIDSFMLRSGAAPHITLAVYDDLDIDAYVTTLGAFATAVAVHAVTFASIGVFPTTGVVFLAPVVTPELLAIHARFPPSSRRAASPRGRTTCRDAGCRIARWRWSSHPPRFPPP